MLEERTESSSLIRVIAGLGNPGERYRKTRHNVGFWVVERLIAKLNAVEVPQFSRGLLNHGHLEFGSVEDLDRELLVYLLRPMEFMNRSGGPIEALLDRLTVEPSQLLVVFDDLDLRLGQIRIRPRGGNGGHNGVGDLIEVLGTDRFSRLRLGIGQSPSGGVIDHVLEPFGQDELPTVEAMVEDATNAALCWLREGVQSAMNRYNAALANSHEASAGGSKADRDAQSGVSQEFSERTKLKVVAPAVAEGAGPVSQTAVKERLYEGMFLLDSNQAAKDWSDLEAHVRGILERHSARIEHAERWPDQRLATEIKGVKKGTYYLTYFYAPTEAIAAIRRDVELTDRILRCMVVQEDFLEEEMKRRQEQARRRAAQPTPHAAPREDPAPPAEEADSFVAEPAAKGNDLLEEEVTAAAEGSVEESFAEEGDHSEGADSSDEKPSQE